MSSARRVFRPTIAGLATPDSPIAVSQIASLAGDCYTDRLLLLLERGR
jgi:hypothetical protein